MWLRRAVYDEREVLDLLVQRRRNRKAVDPTTGAKAAEVKVAGLRLTVRRHPCRRIQYPQSPISSRIPTDAAPRPRRSPPGVGGGDHGGVRPKARQGPFGLGPVNLTVPAI
jgi:hypothetical protein